MNPTFGEKISSTRTAVSLVLLIFSLQWVVYLFFYNDSFVEIHDNLDSAHAWLVLLKDNGLFFASGEAIVPFLGGMERNYLPSELQLGNLLYFLLNPLDAHFLTLFLKTILGFFSFYLFADRFLCESTRIKPLIVFIAFSYALLPGYENLYFAQASLPLVFYLYSRALTEGKPWIFLSLFLYPFLSEFPRYGMFILGFLGMHALFLLARRDIRFGYTLLTLCALTGGYLMTEYRLFSLMFFSDEVTIRTAFNVPPRDLLASVKEAFTEGQYHAASLHKFIILPTAALGLVFLSRWHSASMNKCASVQMATVLALAAASSVIYGIHEGTMLKSVLGEIVPPLAGWNFSRTVWFNPLLWYYAFCLSTAAVWLYVSRYLAYLLAVAQVIMVLSSDVYGNDFFYTVKCHVITCQSQLSYNEFYSPDLFAEVKEKIAYQGEKSLAFGFHPSVLSYNGFNTIDGYHNAYRLAYKEQFRQIIEPALDASLHYARHYDQWGGRAYLFSSDTSFAPKRTYPSAPVALQVDVQKAKAMGARYLFSSYEIAAPETHHLTLIHEARRFPYDLKVYRLE